MKSSVCTLFEGDYHLGAAALVNSLHASGFRGQMFCGLRGPLPPWAGGADRLVLAEGLEVFFLPQATDIHFTNHKPAFLLDLWDGPAAGAESLFYFVPDIDSFGWDIALPPGGPVLIEANLHWGIPTDVPLGDTDYIDYILAQGRAGRFRS